MTRMVKCPVCGESFDRDNESYVKRNDGRYLHSECHNKEEARKDIVSKIHSKMKGLFGANYSAQRINKQISDMKKDGKTESGILRALDYWYDVKGNDPSKANGGISIVNWIYGESLDYWMKKDSNSKKNVDIKIENEPAEIYVIHPQPIRKPKKVKLFNLK